MCDCGCFTPVEDSYDDNSAYHPSTYDITGNPIDYPGYQAPVEVAPVEVAPAPFPSDPGLSTNDQLLNSLNALPAGSPTADVITSVLLQPGHDASVWFQPTHDIYGNSL